MALKKLTSSSSLILLIFALFLPILCIQALFPSVDSNSTKPNPFGFLKHLEGCHNGETVKGVRDLKQYLKKFGYLNNHHADDDDDDAYDELVESAVKVYQTNFHLNTTGSLDSATVEKMMMPRCGVADIVNGTNSMQSRKNKNHQHSSFHTVSHFSFFPGSPRWPDSKTHLTYAFDSRAQRDVLSPICARACARWSSNSHFTFQEIQDYRSSDIRIGVYRGDHGDGAPFDGRGGTLAHASSPPSGMFHYGIFHYDGDERWANGAVPGAIDLQTVAVHEIGHLLGLGHSDVVDAIMYPEIGSGVRKDLHDDDIQGIRALYGR